MLCKKRILKNFAKLGRKNQRQGLFLNKTASWRGKSLLNRDSGAGAILNTFQNTLEHIFCRTSPNGCFYKIMTCKKVPCYMRQSAGRWWSVENVMLKNFEISCGDFDWSMQIRFHQSFNRISSRKQLSKSSANLFFRRIIKKVYKVLKYL